MTVAAFDTETTTGTANPANRNLVYLSDSIYTCLWNGAWEYYYGTLRVMPASASGWTWVNQGIATLTQPDKRLRLTVPLAGAVNVRGLYKSVPAAPWTITVGVAMFANQTLYAAGGLSLWDGTKLVLLQIDQGGSIAVNKFNNASTFSATYGSLQPGLQGSLVWLQIAHTGTQLIYRVGSDPRALIDIMTTAATDFLVATHYGWAGNSQNNQQVALDLYHLSVA